MLWVLTFDPVPRAAADVGRAEPLRDDALEAKLASMTKYHVTRRYDMVVNLQPYRRFGEQPDQQHLAPLDALAPQVITIKLNEVEGVEEHAPVIAPVAQPAKHRQAIIVPSDRLAIDQTRVRLEGIRGGGDQREAPGPVVPVASEQAHARSVAAHQHSEAVVLDLVQPARTGRLGGWAGQAGLAEVGEGDVTQQ